VDYSCDNDKVEGLVVRLNSLLKIRLHDVSLLRAKASIETAALIAAVNRCATQA